MTTAIILAGGLGTRLRGEVPDLPKPMAPINERPFLEYQLDYWIEQGINRFILSVGYRYESIVDYFGENYNGASIDYVIETSPLGTGGGLLLALEEIDKDTPFLLLNGDTYFTVDINKLIDFANKNNADCCFSLFKTNEEDRYMGMEVSTSGRITALKSNTEHVFQLANGGVYWLHPQVLLDGRFSRGDKVSLEDNIFPYLLKAEKRLFGLEFLGTFIDIGVPADYHHAPSKIKTSR